MSLEKIPLLSPKPFAAFEPQEWKDYVTSLYIEPIKAVPKEFSVSVNKKGTLVLRIARDPKYLLSSEIDGIAETIGWTKQQTWLAIRKKKITIRRPLVTSGKKSAPASSKAKK